MIEDDENDDEIRNWGAVSNLDVFFTSLYQYYYHRGFTNILALGIAKLLILFFTISFSTFLFAYVDWNNLNECHNEDSCGEVSDYIKSDPFNKPNTKEALTLLYLILFSIYWSWSLLSFFALIRSSWQMKLFYQNQLNIISNEDLLAMEWDDILKRFLSLHQTGKYRVLIHDHGLSEHDIVSRIMRKDNFLIGLINKGILNITLPLLNSSQEYFHNINKKNKNKTKNIHDGDSYSALPSYEENKNNKNIINNNNNNNNNNEEEEDQQKKSDITNLTRLLLPLSKTFEWCIHFCLLNHMFNHKFQISNSFLNNPNKLRRRFILTGLCLLLLLPFVFIFMLFHFFLRNAQEWRTDKSYLGPREWSPLALWTFREFNELPHIYENRINASYQSANRYQELFPRPLLVIISQIITFITGALVTVLLLLTLFLDEDILLYVKYNDRNLLWYAGILSALYAIFRSFSNSSTNITSSLNSTKYSAGGIFLIEEIETTPENEMKEVAKYTHYFPIHWKNQCHTPLVRDEFLSLYQYKAVTFLQELWGVLITPYLLCFSLPSLSEDIISFIKSHSVNIDGVGSVCDYSQFDFKLYNNKNNNINKNDLELRNKMEMSYLNFKSVHPNCDCGSGGNEFMNKLQNHLMEKSGIKNNLSNIDNKNNNKLFSLKEENDEDIIDDEKKDNVIINNNDNNNNNINNDSINNQSIFQGNSIYSSMLMTNKFNSLYESPSLYGNSMLSQLSPSLIPSEYDFSMALTNSYLPTKSQININNQSIKNNSLLFSRYNPSSNRMKLPKYTALTANSYSLLNDFEEEKLKKLMNDNKKS